MPIRYNLLGIADGDFRMRPGTDKEDDWWMNTKKALFGESAPKIEKRGRPEIKTAYRARCGKMTTDIVDVTGFDWDGTPDKRIFITKNWADGLISFNPGEALMIANADCPVTVIWDLESGLLALLHCALQTLVPPDGSDGILTTCFKEYPLTETMWASLAFGIGKCCFGFTHSVPRCTENSLVMEWPIGTATGIDPSNERFGMPSIDLFALMENQLLRLGMKPNRIISNAKSTLSCTSCKKDFDGKPMYWSNARDGKETGRNLAFVVRTPDLPDPLC